MPGFSANFFEIVIYIVPGFVVLYSFRHLSSSLEEMFRAISSSSGTPTLIALMVLAMANGVIIAGISSITIPFLARMLTPKPKSPMHTHKLNFAKLYDNPDKIQMFLHHMRIYQAYAHMTIALMLSLVAFLWGSKFNSPPTEHWHIKLGILLFFILSMLWAAVRYFRHVFHIADTLSNADN